MSRDPLALPELDLRWEIRCKRMWWEMLTRAVNQLSYDSKASLLTGGIEDMILWSQEEFPQFAMDPEFGRLAGQFWRGWCEAAGFAFTAEPHG